MCAEDNMQVAYCSTPANYFYILRQQLRREFRKLPDPDDTEVASAPQALRLDEIAEGASFHCVAWDDAQLGADGVRLVSDDKIRRVSYAPERSTTDLFEERLKRGINDVYLMRVEQLYPFPVKALSHELARFKAADVVWCQEEPKNIGSWTFVEPYLEWVLGHAGSKSKRPRYVGRPASAATATGLMSKHTAQLNAFLDEAFAA
jgi:2-oxoglutarate dehydrogenase E1 component